MNSSRDPTIHIDRIVSEVSGILRAIGEPIPDPDTSIDLESKQRLEEARRLQLADRERFLKRYQPAILAFLHVVLRNSDAVSVVWERFIAKWLNGKLAKYDPEVGSFRKYLKTVLRNECRAYFNEKSVRDPETRLASHLDFEAREEATADRAFDDHLRKTILRRAVDAIKEENRIYHEIVCQMSGAIDQNEPPPSTSELAKHLALLFGGTYEEANVRQLKKRAKEKLAEKIIDQTGLVIDSSLLCEIEEVLTDLKMLVYCQKTISRLKGDS